MTKDDIRKLAHEAGLHLATDVHWMPIIGFDYAEKLIALAAQREREACAELCESRQTPGTGSVAILNGAADAIRARTTT